MNSNLLNEQFKLVKSVEEIAKKHRLEVSFIQKQLDMGEPIEHEHTKDHKLAKKIALQHLDEIPDYYTRLKKMEVDAKKHHKKFKDVKINEEGLRKWFQSKSKNGKKGWVDVVDGDACAREEGETATPKCVSSEKRASMTKSERLAAQAAKRREDPNQPEKSGAAKPTMVRTDRKTRKEEMEITEVKDKPGKGSGKKDACYHKVKSRYSVWPSAYASGALVKCRKVGADNWGTKSEQTEMIRYCPKCDKNETRSECSYGPKYWDMFSLPVLLGSTKKYDPNKPHPANEEKDHEHSMARSQLTTVINAARRLKKKMKGEGNIEAWVQSKITKAADYLDSAADYVDSGEMKVESVESGPILPKEKGKRVYPKGKEPKPTGAKLPEIRKESITIEDSNGNSFAEVINIINPEPLKPSEGIGSRMLDLDEAGKKCWKGYRKAGTQKIFGKRYNRCVKEGNKTFGEFMEAVDKSKMKCNSPKSDPVGDSLTGKSHVVKACEGGKEKIIRFGQRGVKGSPKKKGESKEYASRRHRFQTRHAKNIAKGKMSAAYWANKVKW